MLLHKAPPAADGKVVGGTLDMARDVTEELFADFGGRLTRAVIRKYVVEAILDLRGSAKQSELRDIVRLVATFRLSAVNDSLTGPPISA